MSEELTRIDGRLERIETKLDNHLERVAKLEEATHSMRGSIRILYTILLGVLSAVFTYFTGVRLQ